MYPSSCACLAGIGLALVASACGPDTPSDDPADWDVDTSVEYVVTPSEPRFVVPSNPLPAEVGLDHANNNVEIIFHQGRLFMAWRQAETHFASPDVKMQVVSSEDEGVTWAYETTIAIGTDVREPRFVSIEGYQILVGRNNEQNDRLTMRVANGNDLWLHVGGGRPGSHVVIRLPKNKTASLETLLDAGTLAVHFSKARGEHRIEVVYTHKKHVRKPKGLPAGAVVPSQTRSLTVHLDPGRLRRLLDSGGDDADGCRIDPGEPTGKTRA